VTGGALWRVRRASHLALGIASQTYPFPAPSAFGCRLSSSPTTSTAPRDRTSKATIALFAAINTLSYRTPTRPPVRPLLQLA
jgi:hypothetical protein